MNVTFHQRNLCEIRERYRLIHSQNTAQVDKLVKQIHEQNMKLMEVQPNAQPSPQPTTVDVRV